MGNSCWSTHWVSIWPSSENLPQLLGHGTSRSVKFIDGWSWLKTKIDFLFIRILGTFVGPWGATYKCISWITPKDISMEFLLQKLFKFSVKQVQFCVLSFWRIKSCIYRQFGKKTLIHHSNTNSIILERWHIQTRILIGRLKGCGCAVKRDCCTYQLVCCYLSQAQFSASTSTSSLVWNSRLFPGIPI